MIFPSILITTDITPIQGNVVSVVPNFVTEFCLELRISNIRVNKTEKFNVFQVAKIGTSNTDIGNKLVALNFRTKPKKKPRFEIITQLDGKTRVRKTGPLQENSLDSGNTEVFDGPFVFEIFQSKNEKNKFVTTIGFIHLLLSGTNLYF